MTTRLETTDGGLTFNDIDPPPVPTMSGDTAAGIISGLHAKAELMQYHFVRIDRDQHSSGAYVEMGCAMGEVRVRLSHRPNYSILKDTPDVLHDFEVELDLNVRAAKLDARRAKQEERGEIRRPKTPGRKASK